MTPARCPCCGHSVIPPVALPLIKQQILDVVRRRPGIDAEALRCLVWAHDPGGGPEDRKVIHVHIHQLNRLLSPHGIVVRSRSGGYRIVSRGAAAS
jgi:DNA-binding response OmpR family regulator